MSPMRPLRSLIPLVAALLFPVLPAEAAASTVPAAAGTFATAGDVITYRPDLVPVGAHAAVVSLPTTGTTVLLGVRGLLPERRYGAHVHTRACGPAPTDAGPHFQHVVDPVQPSVDPAYANPENEIWLDFTTDRRGNAFAVAAVDWRFAERRGGSVVVHETHTHTTPGQAGTAGARLACITVPF